MIQSFHKKPNAKNIRIPWKLKENPIKSVIKKLYTIDQISRKNKHEVAVRVWKNSKLRKKEKRNRLG